MFSRSPVIGGRLASISVRGPYLAAGLAYLVQTAVTALCVPETLPRKLRKRFTLRAASPLSVLALFRRGPKLRALAVLATLNELWCERRNITEGLLFSCFNVLMKQVELPRQARDTRLREAHNRMGAQILHTTQQRPAAPDDMRHAEGRSLG
jgi:hypothetical protein